MIGHDDILGTRSAQAPRPRAKPRTGSQRMRDKKVLQQASNEKKATNFDELLRPVSISQLMLVFRMDRATVKKKIAPLDPIGNGTGGAPVYDFLQACRYLVVPKYNAKEIIAKLGPGDMPNSLQKDFWVARKAEQNFRRDAGELWHTSDVQTVLGDAWQRLKNASNQAVGQVEAVHEVSPEVRDMLVKLMDGMLDTMHKALVEMPLAKQTTSSESDLDGTLD